MIHMPQKKQKIKYKMFYYYMNLSLNSSDDIDFTYDTSKHNILSQFLCEYP